MAATLAATLAVGMPVLRMLYQLGSDLFLMMRAKAVCVAWRAAADGYLAPSMERLGHERCLRALGHAPQWFMAEMNGNLNTWRVPHSKRPRSRLLEAAVQTESSDLCRWLDTRHRFTFTDALARDRAVLRCRGADSVEDFLRELPCTYEWQFRPCRRRCTECTARETRRRGMLPRLALLRPSRRCQNLALE